MKFVGILFKDHPVDMTIHQHTAHRKNKYKAHNRDHLENAYFYINLLHVVLAILSTHPQ